MGDLGSSSITACYATGDIEVSGSTIYGGGLVGNFGNRSSIRACYATGNIEASATAASDVAIDSDASYVGGLVGDVMDIHSSIRASYATGNVEVSSTPDSSTSYVSGLVGSLILIQAAVTTVATPSSEAASLAHQAIR